MKRTTIAEIKERLSEKNELSEQEMQLLKSDARIGVRRLLRKWEERKAYFQKLIVKYHQMNRFEDELKNEGARCIAGIDEAGRGPLAGPVVAACVVLKSDAMIPGINDSKQLSVGKREYLYERICESADAFGVGIVSAHEIDKINIYQAAKKAMILAIEKMDRVPDHLLIDAMELPLDIPQTSLIKGDARSNSIAAASILAKVTRDRLMCDLDRIYPGYDFSKHKGYGTQAHLQAIERLGTCPEHRMTFAPLKP
ncbi:ribonuclease HII [Sporolactobacillus shoreicorticis]|uniref:Ribonuclease HII n=1 Tax=Sporolactobacillus shoreicorticis TaxID=1923877 RepID=A0ABW5SBH2_9BACL|nr:ribonuclease HII [Sporolactobacillus shoreicorticis]MCO7126010.1 ribonuclease HII [Sporolactobacillus shoreicorticis]